MRKIKNTKYGFLYTFIFIVLLVTLMSCGKKTNPSHPKGSLSIDVTPNTVVWTLKGPETRSDTGDKTETNLTPGSYTLSRLRENSYEFLELP